MNALALARTNSSYLAPRITTSAPKKHYDRVVNFDQPSDDAIESAIQEWLDDTAFLSSIDDMRAVPSYSALVAFGRVALPKIIASLSVSPSLLGMAAADIVGDDPITDEIRGDVRAMTGAWIGWYQRAKRDFV